MKFKISLLLLLIIATIIVVPMIFKLISVAEETQVATKRMGTDVLPRVEKIVTTYERSGSPQLRLQDRLVVTVNTKSSNGAPTDRTKPSDSDRPTDSLFQWAATKKNQTQTEKEVIEKLVPYVDGIMIRGVYPRVFRVDPDTTQLTYFLESNEHSLKDWTMLLGRPLGKPDREISFTVGTEQGDALATNYGPGKYPVYLLLFSRWGFIPLVGILLLIGWFVWLARTTDIVRDAEDGPSCPGSMRPYSLARVQLAFWLIVVVGSFLLITLVTRTASPLSDTVLILIGLSTATTGGALVIDRDRRTKRREKEWIQDRVAKLKLAAENEQDPLAKSKLLDELATAEVELGELQKKLGVDAAQRDPRKSEHFLIDILSDEAGVSLHRLQIAIWTVVMGGFFVVAVWRTLSMPDFAPGLLALMGISSGTYLGFKTAESK